MTKRLAHTCHIPGCETPCPPRHLFCGTHWAMVPRDLQDEVYATVKKRGRYIDASWAPWWRAQAKATAAVLRKTRPVGDSERIDKWLAHEMDVASKMEAIDG